MGRFVDQVVREVRAEDARAAAYRRYRRREWRRLCVIVYRNRLQARLRQAARFVAGFGARLGRGIGTRTVRRVRLARAATSNRDDPDPAPELISQHFSWRPSRASRARAFFIQRERRARFSSRHEMWAGVVNGVPLTANNLASRGSGDSLRGGQ